MHPLVSSISCLELGPSGHHDWPVMSANRTSRIPTHAYAETGFQENRSCLVAFPESGCQPRSTLCDAVAFRFRRDPDVVGVPPNYPGHTTTQVWEGGFTSNRHFRIAEVMGGQITDQEAHRHRSADRNRRRASIPVFQLRSRLRPAPSCARFANTRPAR